MGSKHLHKSITISKVQYHLGKGVCFTVNTDTNNIYVDIVDMISL